MNEKTEGPPVVHKHSDETIPLNVTENTTLIVEKIVERLDAQDKILQTQDSIIQTQNCTIQKLQEMSEELKKGNQISFRLAFIAILVSIVGILFCLIR
jgi:hypothetical protein